MKNLYRYISDTLQRRFPRLIIIDSCNEFHRAKIGERGGGEGTRPRGITQFIYPFIIDLIKTANSTIAPPLPMDTACPIWNRSSRISWNFINEKYSRKFERECKIFKINRSLRYNIVMDVILIN